MAVGSQKQLSEHQHVLIMIKAVAGFVSWRASAAILKALAF